MRRQHNAKPRPLFFIVSECCGVDSERDHEIYLFAPVTSTVNIVFSFRSRDRTSIMRSIGFVGH